MREGERFVYPYLGVDMLWEVVAYHGPIIGALCQTVDGVYNQKKYYSCGASAYFTVEHLEILLANNQEGSHK